MVGRMWGAGSLRRGLSRFWSWGRGLQKENGRYAVPQAKLFPGRTGGKAPGSLLAAHLTYVCPNWLLLGKPAVGATLCGACGLGTGFPLRQIPPVKTNLPRATLVPGLTCPTGAPALGGSCSTSRAESVFLPGPCSLAPSSGRTWKRRARLQCRLTTAQTGPQRTLTTAQTHLLLLRVSISPLTGRVCVLPHQLQETRSCCGWTAQGLAQSGYERDLCPKSLTPGSEPHAQPHSQPRFIQFNWA